VHRARRKNNPYRRKALVEVKRLARKIHAAFHPAKLQLFGSVARGDVHALSDIDLLIVAGFSGSRRDRVEQVLDLVEDLDLTFPVEPLPLRPEEYQAIRHRSFFKQIEREAIDL